ncbi:MAG: hypothetical protein C0518_03730 [Opitutus sp.]|nr:hypothetical protein [Opitutus sp.]
MTRFALPFLLVLSLAANLWLAVRSSRTTAASPPGSTVADAKSSRASSANAEKPSVSASAAALAEKFSSARSTGELRAVVAELRALGLPENLIRSVIQSLVHQEIGRRQREIFDWTAVPYWKNPAPSKEQQQAMRALEKDRRALLADLGLPPQGTEPAARQRQYGNLSETKISAIEKIQQDYNELRTEMYEQSRNTPRDGRDIAAQQKLLNDEMQRDIDALLNPQEKLEYELRSSETANRLREQLRSLDLTEPEYRALFTAQKTYDNGRATTGPRTAEQSQGDVARWDELQAQARGTLGDERYKQYLLTAQLAGRGADQFFAAHPAITVDQIQAIARLNNSAPAEMLRELNAPGLSGEERRARAAAITQRHQDALTQLVGADVARELLTRNIVSLPRSLGSGAVGMPAVRLPGGGG